MNPRSDWQGGIWPTLSDAELLAVAEELEERAEQFTATVRQQLADELCRRRLK